MSEAGHPLNEAWAAPGQSVRPEHSSTFLRLGQLWQRSGHFSLLLAAVDDSSYRDRLITRLQTLGPAQRIDLAPTDTPQDWLNRVQQAHAECALRVQVCLPISPRRPDAWWQQANVLRERLGDALPAAQLLWMADSDVDAAAHQAPDLWNWREAVFSFLASVPAAGLPALPGEAFRSSSGQEAAAVAERLGHIERVLASQPADASAAAHLWLEAAQAHERLGHWPAAEAAAQRAATGFQQAGNAVSEAQARALRAELQWLRGDPLGEEREKAVALFKVADLQAAQGHRCEALRLLMDEVLPVFEQLGLAREVDITRQRIAVLRPQN